MKRNKSYISKTLLLASLLGLQSPAFAQEPGDSLINVAFGKQAIKDVLGGVSSVNVTQLMKKDYHSYSLDGLQGLIGGYDGNVWGKNPLILVDGVVRSASTINATEVEEVTVMKAASAIALYGSKGANGVILITTKRGKNQRLTIDATLNTGLSFAKRYPHYLGSAEYMSLYNEACANDGKAARYSADDIYNTAAGTNPYRYPDMNFYSSDYLRKAANRTDGTVEITGGNENAKYYANFGMVYNNGFVKYGDKKNDDEFDFRVRSNIDMKIASWLNAFANVDINIDNAYAGRGEFWNAATTLRPNKYSPLIPISMIDPYNKDLQSLVSTGKPVLGDQYLLGGTNTDQTTVFGDMLRAGYIKDKFRTFTFDVGLNADLSMLLKGLSFKTAFSVDYWDYYTEGYKVDYAVYNPTWSNVNGKDMIIGLTKINTDKSSTSEFVGRSSYYQTMTFRGQFDYDRCFNDVHNFSATLMGWGYQQQNSSDEDHESSAYHRVTNVNMGLQARYNYDHRYYAELGTALVHSPKLPEGKRNALSPSLTLGWRFGKESFIKDNLPFVDDAKIDAAYSVLNQDINITDYYMYKGYYNQKGGWYTWFDGNSGGDCNASSRGANDNLGFIKRKELRFGLDTSLFNHALTVDLNWFSQLTDGLLTNGAYTIYPSYFTGNGSFLPNLNFNQNKTTGIDFSVNYNKKLGDVDLTVGVNGQYLSMKAEKRDELNEFDYLNATGKDLNAAWGYVCDGFFNSQEEIDAYSKTTKTTFGEVKPGDLKYKDINGDNVIDSKDQIDLGNYYAPFQYGFNITLKYKNLTFFALATGQMGGMNFWNNSYYWVNGDSKYSEIVRGRWTPETASSASYPRLTTTTNNNNFRNSTFWKYSTDRLDLNRIQITYDMPEKWFENKIVKSMSVYVLGESLFTISGHTKEFETNIGSPQCRFYNIGMKLSF